MRDIATTGHRGIPSAISSRQPCGRTSHPLEPMACVVTIHIFVESKKCTISLTAWCEGLRQSSVVGKRKSDDSVSETKCTATGQRVTPQPLVDRSGWDSGRMRRSTPKCAGTAVDHDTGVCMGDNDTFTTVYRQHVGAALHRLGIRVLVFALQEPSFPPLPGADTGRGSPILCGGAAPTALRARAWLQRRTVRAPGRNVTGERLALRRHHLFPQYPVDRSRSSS